MPETKTLAARVSEFATAVGTQLKATNKNVSKNGSDITALAAKIAQDIADAKVAVKNEILNGASTAYDTLKEIEDLLKANDEVLGALQALNVVKYDAQTLTTEQKAQARENIGAASASDLSSLSDAVGDTDTDFVTAFTTALNAADSDPEQNGD